jgi:hypothetical protein
MRRLAVLLLGRLNLEQWVPYEERAESGTKRKADVRDARESRKYVSA